MTPLHRFAPALLAAVMVAAPTLAAVLQQPPEEAARAAGPVEGLRLGLAAPEGQTSLHDLLSQLP